MAEDAGNVEQRSPATYDEIAREEKALQRVL